MRIWATLVGIHESLCKASHISILEDSTLVENFYTIVDFHFDSENGELSFSCIGFDDFQEKAFIFTESNNTLCPVQNNMVEVVDINGTILSLCFFKQLEIYTPPQQ